MDEFLGIKINRNKDSVELNQNRLIEDLIASVDYDLEKIKCYNSPDKTNVGVIPPCDDDNSILSDKDQ